MEVISLRSLARTYLMVADEYPVDKADMQRETMELVLGEVPPLSASRTTNICNGIRGCIAALPVLWMPPSPPPRGGGGGGGILYAWHFRLRAASFACLAGGT